MDSDYINKLTAKFAAARKAGSFIQSGNPVSDPYFVPNIGSPYVDAEGKPVVPNSTGVWAYAKPGFGPNNPPRVIDNRKGEDLLTSWNVGDTSILPSRMLTGDAPYDRFVPTWQGVKSDYASEDGQPDMRVHIPNASGDGQVFADMLGTALTYGLPIEAGRRAYNHVSDYVNRPNPESFNPITTPFKTMDRMSQPEMAYALERRMGLAPGSLAGSSVKATVPGSPNFFGDKDVTFDDVAELIAARRTPGVIDVPFDAFNSYREAKKLDPTLTYEGHMLDRLQSVSTAAAKKQQLETELATLRSQLDSARQSRDDSRAKAEMSLSDIERSRLKELKQRQLIAAQSVNDAKDRLRRAQAFMDNHRAGVSSLGFMTPDMIAQEDQLQKTLEAARKKFQTAEGEYDKLLKEEKAMGSGRVQSPELDALERAYTEAEAAHKAMDAKLKEFIAKDLVEAEKIQNETATHYQPGQNPKGNPLAAIDLAIAGEQGSPTAKTRVRTKGLRSMPIAEFGRTGGKKGLIGKAIRYGVPAALAGLGVPARNYLRTGQFDPLMVDIDEIDLPGGNALWTNDSVSRLRQALQDTNQSNPFGMIYGNSELLKDRNFGDGRIYSYDHLQSKPKGF